MEANTLHRESKEPKTEAQVLVVEDEVEIRELISLILLRQGCRVQQCGTAVEALEKINKTKFDLVILDWMLPKMSGIEFLKSFGSAANRAPVLMVTAKSEPTDIVLGLESGADDYVTKPFEPAVFSARVKALLRRTSSVDTGNHKAEELQIGALYMNSATYAVRVGDEALHLTPSEFKILAAMAENQGRVLTRDKLITLVQGEGISVTGRTIDTHVFGLRKKMGSAADLIETIRGVGYRIKSE